MWFYGIHNIIIKLNYAYWVMWTKGIGGRGLSDTLHQHLIDISINAWSTLDRHLSQQSIKKQLIKWVNTSSESTLGRLLTDCQSSANQDVDGLSIEGTDWHLTAEAIDTQWSLCLSYLTLILLRCQSVAESVCKRNAWQAWKPSS